VAPGKLLAGVGVDQLPVVLLSLVGLAEESADNTVSSNVIDAVIDEVAALQLLGAGFGPCFCSTYLPSVEHAAMATSRLSPLPLVLGG
jgi:hypothetical protein